MEQAVTLTSWRRTDDADTWGDFYRWVVGEKLRIPTGYPSFDRACAGGLQEGWMVTICGTDSAGKTNILLGMALEACSAGYTVGIINLDMDWRLWCLRMVSKIGNISASELLETEQFELGQQEKLEGIMMKIRDLPGAIALDDSMPSNITDVRNSINSLVGAGARLIIVDYLQLIQSDQMYGNAVSEFDEVVKGVKRAGLDHGIPVLCAAQLNRKAKTDEDPHVHHVLGGTALERHGDINVVIDHRHKPLGEGVSKIKMRIEKNKPVGRLYEWDVRFDRRTMGMTELYVPA